MVSGLGQWGLVGDSKSVFRCGRIRCVPMCYANSKEQCIAYTIVDAVGAPI